MRLQTSLSEQVLYKVVKNQAAGIIGTNLDSYKHFSLSTSLQRSKVRMALAEL